MLASVINRTTHIGTAGPSCPGQSPPCVHLLRALQLLLLVNGKLEVLQLWNAPPQLLRGGAHALAREQVLQEHGRAHGFGQAGTAGAPCMSSLQGRNMSGHEAMAACAWSETTTGGRAS